MASKKGKQFSTSRAFSATSQVKTKRCSHCLKVSFLDEISAKIVLAKRSYKEKGERRVYPCPFGKGWHLTSKA